MLAAILADIENPKIDKSNWLPRRSQIVTSERIEKGDIENLNGRYQIKYPHPVDWLKEVRIIDADGHQAALDLLSLYEVAFSALSYARMRFFANWLGRTADDGLDPQTIYTRIMRIMLPYQRSLIERICFQPIRKNDEAWMNNLSHSIDKSFTALAKAVDTIRESIVDSKIEEGRSVSKIPQPDSVN